MKKLSLVVVLVAILALVFAAGFASPAQAKGQMTLVYFDGHMHTIYSDGTGTIAEIKATALARGLGVVIVTDHCEDLTEADWDALVAEAAAASDGDVLVMVGFEVTGVEGMLNRDHIVALRVVDPFVDRYGDDLCPSEVWPSPPNPNGTGPVHPEHIKRWVDFIHSQQGIAIHVHPSGSTSLEYGVKHIEVYNQDAVDNLTGFAMLLGIPPDLAWGLAMTVNNTTLNGEQDLNMLVPFPGVPEPIPLRTALYMATLQFTGVGQWLGSPEAPLMSWDELLMAYVDGSVEDPIFILANSDDHKTGDGDGSTVGLAKNGVYVKGELTDRKFFQALKAGRSFATTGPSLGFKVDGEHMGDEAFVSDGSVDIALSTSSESPTAIIVQVVIVKNGEPWMAFSPMSPTYEGELVDNAVTEDGYYRVEITTLDMATGAYAFAWSNPVFIFTD